MTDVSGMGATTAQTSIELVTNGGIEIHLCDTAVSKTDSATDIDGKSALSQNVAEADTTITTATDFSGVDTLANDVDVVFDVSTNTEIIVDVVIRSQTDDSQWLVADELNDPDLSENDEYRIDANTTLYEHGNPT